MRREQARSRQAVEFRFVQRVDVGNHIADIVEVDDRFRPHESGEKKAKPGIAGFRIGAEKAVVLVCFRIRRERSVAKPDSEFRRSDADGQCRYEGHIHLAGISDFLV